VLQCQHGLAQLSMYRGNLYRSLQQWEQALAVLGEARAAYDRILRTDPAFVQALGEQAQDCRAIAQVFRAQGRKTEAAAPLADACAFIAKAASVSSDRTGAQLAQARACADLADLYDELGRPAEALPVRRQAQALCAQFAGAAPVDQQVLPEFADCVKDVARGLRASGHREEARAVLAQATPCRERAQGQAPGDAAWQRRLEEHYRLLADLQRELGKK
jgi:tetratricopeptide (TPR) repeat protein